MASFLGNGGYDHTHAVISTGAAAKGEPQTLMSF